MSDTATGSPSLKRSVLFNLAVLIQRPTGHSVCINNVVPPLVSATSTLLVNETLQPSWNANHPEATVMPVSSQLSPDSGRLAYPRRLLWNDARLPRLFRQSGAELLYSPLPEVPLVGKIPSVATVYDFIPARHFAPRSPARIYTERYVPLALRRASHVLAISQATADEAMQRCGLSASKITVTPLGYDRQVFRFLELPTLPYVLYVGRLPEYKNVTRAVSAFASVRTHRDFEFVIAGPDDPEHSSTLQTHARELNVRLRFVSYPEASELARLMNQATVLIHPSLSEGFGLTVLEAMACGTPVVASNTTSIPEVAGDATLLVDPTDTRAMTAALELALTDSALRADLRTRGLERAALFTWESTQRLTAEVLNGF